ncbi:MAG: hypothetical protein Q7R40_03985 [Phaeospirillum sp.]|nr:hypothetical protein [Phaeospirillum sp.]
MIRGMVKIWAIALVWLLATGVASALHWDDWSQRHPVMAPEDCTLQFSPSSAELVGCYQERMEAALDRRAELTLHLGIPLIPVGILAFLALGVGWLQRY